ncbi:MAG TPA: tetratricopeptide repeat protein [Candidatus Polarisedimenticolia bacterium]|jgi:tetratricopeptide (TPR) repeat protein
MSPHRSNLLTLSILGTFLGLGGIGLFGWTYVALERSAAGRASGNPLSLGTDPAAEPTRESLMARSRALLEASDYSGAVSALDRALEISPGDAEALALQVRAFRAQRQLGRASATARRILDRFPGSPLPHLLLGSIAVQEGDAAAARRSFERALALDTSGSLAVAQLASLDLMEGRADDARRHAVQSLALDPTGALALGTLFQVSRSVPELISLCTRLLEVSPGDRLTRSWLEVLKASRAPEVNHFAPIDGEATISCERAADGRLYVRADIGSRRARRFLLDTGGSGLVLSETLARRMGMKLREFADSAGVGGLTRHSHPILLSRVAIGGIRMREMMATASNLEAGLDGILNPLVLAPPGSGLVIELRPAAGLLLLRKERLSPRRPGQPESAGWATSPFLRDGNHVIFHIVLAGRPAVTLLDTGAAADLLDRSMLRGLPGVTVLPAPEVGESLIGFGGRIDGVATLQGVPLRIAGLDLDARLLYALDLNTEPFRLLVDLDAVIGIERLAAFDLKIDPSSGLLAFRPVP